MNATTPSPSNDRRGMFGTAQPAFSVSRFKRTINMAMNEEFAAELQTVLLNNERAIEDKGGQIPRFLYEFLNQLDDCLKQQPPQRGEKPRKREAA